MLALESPAGRVSRHFFLLGMDVSTNTSSLEASLGNVMNAHGGGFMGLFLGFLPYSIVYMSVFLPVSYDFNYCNFIVQFEIRAHAQGSCFSR